MGWENHLFPLGPWLPWLCYIARGYVNEPYVGPYVVGIFPHKPDRYGPYIW